MNFHGEKRSNETHVSTTDPDALMARKGSGLEDFRRDDECRNMRVTPHVAQNTMAQNTKRNGGSAIDGRTARHEGYAVSQTKRKKIEECFGWLKTIALMRRVQHRGIEKVGWVFTFAAAAYNLVRVRKLLASRVGAA